MKDIHAVIDEVIPWVARNFPRETREMGGLGVSEEAGEVCRAILKQAEGIRGTYEEWDDEIKKEIGDVFIKIIHISYICSFNFEEIVSNRWETISQRDWIKDPKGHGIS